MMREQTWLTAVTIVPILLSACASAEGKKEGFGRLSVAEVAAKRTDKNFYVYDNNHKSVFDDGHVPGAKWLDSSAVTAADLPADKDATLVFYCANEH
jgi:rhodanese-related sulfurtransferase